MSRINWEEIDKALISEYKIHADSCRTLARRYNLSESSVLRHIKELKIEPPQIKRHNYSSPQEIDWSRLDKIITEEYLNNESQLDIARKYNIERSTIGKRLKKLGVTRKPLRREYDFGVIGKEIVREYEETTVTTGELATKYGVPDGSIRGFLDKSGVQRRTQSQESKFQWSLDRPFYKTTIVCISCRDKFIPTSGKKKTCLGCVPDQRFSRRFIEYGITKKHWDRILVVQGGICALCSNEPTQVEHNHKTGKVRGLVCVRCNAFMARMDIDGWADRVPGYLQNNWPLFNYYTKRDRSGNKQRDTCEICKEIMISEHCNQRWCKVCIPDKIAHKRYIKYGVDDRTYKLMLEKYNGLCALCLKSGLCIDHNHKTGAVRGLLCKVCNIGLAVIENYGLEWLNKAIIYRDSEAAL